MLCDKVYLLTACFVLGHMACHVPDGCCRILQVRICQLVVMCRKEPTAIQMTEVVSTQAACRAMRQMNIAQHLTCALRDLWTCDAESFLQADGLSWVALIWSASEDNHTARGRSQHAGKELCAPQPTLPMLCLPCWA